MQPPAILESALYVTDLGAAERSISEMLGLEIIAKAEGRHVFFRCGQGVLLLFNAEATRNQPAPARNCRCRRTAQRAKDIFALPRRPTKSTAGKRALEDEGHRHRSRFRMAG